MPYSWGCGVAEDHFMNFVKVNASCVHLTAVRLSWARLTGACIYLSKQAIFTILVTLTMRILSILISTGSRRVSNIRVHNESVRMCLPWQAHCFGWCPNYRCLTIQTPWPSCFLFYHFHVALNFSIFLKLPHYLLSVLKCWWQSSYKVCKIRPLWWKRNFKLCDTGTDKRLGSREKFGLFVIDNKGSRSRRHLWWSMTIPNFN